MPDVRAPVGEVERGDEAADADAARKDADLPNGRYFRVERIARGWIDKNALMRILDKRRHHVCMIVEVNDDQIIIRRAAAQMISDETAAPGILETQIKQIALQSIRKDVVRGDLRVELFECGREVWVECVVVHVRAE